LSSFTKTAVSSPTVFRNNVSGALVEIERPKVVCKDAPEQHVHHSFFTKILCLMTFDAHRQDAYQPGSTPQNTGPHQLHDQLTLTIQYAQSRSSSHTRMSILMLCQTTPSLKFSTLLIPVHQITFLTVLAFEVRCLFEGWTRRSSLWFKMLSLHLGSYPNSTTSSVVDTSK